MLERFDKRFGIKESLKEEQTRFVQRINQTIFKNIKKEYGYEKVFRTICYWLGENADDRISNVTSRYATGLFYIPNLRSLTNDNFLETLKILTPLYQYFNKDSQKQGKISKWVEVALSNATIELGVSWKDGMFYPSGAKILDEKLIEDPFDWLNEFPDEKKDFADALSHYIKKNYGDVVSNCYLVVEGLARRILNNQRTLDNNRDELLGKLRLSQSWKSLLNNYTNYANEFKRHASNKRHSINPQEVEAFLYLTGLLARLIIQSEKI